GRDRGEAVRPRSTLLRAVAPRRDRRGAAARHGPDPRGAFRRCGPSADAVTRAARASGAARPAASRRRPRLAHVPAVRVPGPAPRPPGTHRWAAERPGGPALPSFAPALAAVDGVARGPLAAGSPRCHRAPNRPPNPPSGDLRPTNLPAAVPPRA